jgi:hypothetical protein
MIFYTEKALYWRKSNRKTISKSQNMKPTGTWHIKTNKVDNHIFYHGYPDINPFYSINGFDQEDNWLIDSGSIESPLKKVYDIYPDDDSFVLIPKDEVIKVWFTPYKN